MTTTFTFGERAENHVGMQMIGSSNIADRGFSYEDLSLFKAKFDEIGVVSEIYSLCTEIKGPSSHILVCKDVLATLVDKNAFKIESNALAKLWDTKYYDVRRQKVLNKRARYNLCFSEEGQQSDYANRKGTVVSYKDFPSLLLVKNKLETLLGDLVKGLSIEGNYYYDTSKCYIGYHGDSERKKVIGLRIGESFPLHFQWYDKTEAVGNRMQVNLGDGDMYFMSEYTSGFNWMHRPRNLHLRHAAGSHKLIGLSPNVTILN
jgi:hypothetical protein